MFPLFREREREDKSMSKLLYKVTFTPTALDEYFTYAECVDFFGREEFKDVLKGRSTEATAYPIDSEEAA